MEVFETLSQLEWCSNYLSYIQLRQKGLKRESKTALTLFLIDYTKQDKTARRDFIDIIHTHAFFTEEYTLYLPYNLWHDLTKRDIQDWIKDEPGNPIPYRWSYEFDLIRQALLLDPNDQLTLALFGRMTINGIRINQEIPTGGHYDGNPAEDIASIDFFTGYLENIVDLEIKAKFKQELIELKEFALAYTIL